MTFGKLIRMYRQMRRMTQNELSERSGLTQSYISRLERDDAKATIEDVRALARAFGVSPADMIRALEEGQEELKLLNVPAVTTLLREAGFTPQEIEQVVLFLHAVKPAAVPLRWAWDPSRPNESNAMVTV